MNASSYAAENGRLLAAIGTPMVPSSTFKSWRRFVTMQPTTTKMFLLASVLVAVGLGAATLSAEESVTIASSADYFPDTLGSRWTYRGQMSEGPLQTIENKFFTNVSTVTGTKTIKGVAVTVFHDTNPGNHGPSDSYYRRDSVGIVYYGADPGTPLEKQITPYQIFRFPLKVPTSFQQFDRTGLDFGMDLDRDGTDEKTDVKGWSTVLSRETVTVPAGTFAEAIKVEARMTMRIHLSASRRTIAGLDIMTAWFAKGVGLVKYSERQEMGAVKEDRGVVVELSEELEECEIKPAKGSVSGLESPSEGILADHAGDHELNQVVLAAGLRAHP